MSNFEREPGKKVDWSLTSLLGETISPEDEDAVADFMARLVTGKSIKTLQKPKNAREMLEKLTNHSYRDDKKEE